MTVPEDFNAAHIHNREGDNFENFRTRWGEGGSHLKILSPAKGVGQ